MTNKAFIVEKRNFFNISQRDLALPELKGGEVRFKIDKYALTTNNITYAVSGFRLKYWEFFPVDDEQGIIPVWGFGEVVASKHPDVKVGEMCYGYFPMADYLTVQPAQITPFGFSDNAEHRRKLAPIYNNYSRVAADPSFNEATDDYMPIIKPLFSTSFLIYYFLKKEGFFNSEQMVLTSASSKTGLALAFMLKKHQETDGKKIIGLTSKRNVEFVKSTGYYDQVIAYEDYPNQLTNTGTVVIDFAGNYKLLKGLSDQLGELLAKITLVGLTDWKALGSYSKIPNTEFFFAPTHIQILFKEWGVEKTQLKLNKALVEFIQDTKKMIELEFIPDFEAFSKIYIDMVNGKVDPKKGYIYKI